MRQLGLVLAVMVTFAPSGLTQQTGPYKVLKTTRVGREGSWDYIYADVAGRRLYIPRRGTPAAPEVQTRLSIYNLDTLELVGEIAAWAARGPRSIRSRAMVSPAASRSRCSTPKPWCSSRPLMPAPHSRTASTSIPITKGSTSSVTRQRTLR